MENRGFMDKKDYINEFENCFINNLDESLFVDLDLAKKNYDTIQKTSKASKVCLALAGACFSGSVITFMFPKIVAGFGAAFLLSLPAGIVLNSVARHKFRGLKEEGELHDYLNYDIYAKNEFIVNRVNELKGKNDCEKRTAGMLKNNLDKLFNLDSTLKSELEGLEDYYLDRIDDAYQTGENINDIKAEKELYMGQIIKTTGNIKNHIDANLDIYSTFVPEYKEKIMSI